MKSLVLASPDHMPTSNGKHPDHQICNAKNPDHQIPNVDCPCDQIFDLGAVEEASNIKHRVTLDGGLIGPGVTSNFSIAEAPVTPLTERENGRRCSLSSLTPLTSVSSHSCSNNGDFYIENKHSSSVEDNTPEHSTFDPFASGPDQLVFAPKKSFKPKTVFGNVDDHDASKNTKKHCKIRSSRSSVARVLCFDDVENENDGVSNEKPPSCREFIFSNDRIGDGRITTAKGPFCSSEHSKETECCENCSVNGSNKLMISPNEDVLVEESFVETMCGSFLQAILSKHYEDANIDHNQGKNDDNLSHGPEQSAPATPVEPKLFDNVVDSCPGAPVKGKPKARSRDAGFGSVCRKLEF